MLKFDFTGQNVLITGATKGIGKETADLFEDSGANLILTGIEEDLVNQFNELYKNRNRKYYLTDFTKAESFNGFIKELDKYDKIDVCINNAGINIIDDFVVTKDKDFNKVMEINLIAPYKLSKYIAARMIPKNYGRIINICSIWSKISRPKRAVYVTSKNALYGLTQAMSVELAQYNILVNAVSPGFTLTELTRATNTPEEIKQLSNAIPIKRMAEPIELARTILFLASNLNTYLTGQNIIVDGGYTNV